MSNMNISWENFIAYMIAHGGDREIAYMLAIPTPTANLPMLQPHAFCVILICNKIEQQIELFIMIIRAIPRHLLYL
jgi:hypothetical protein